MANISISELKTNTGKYVALAQKQDIFITKNGKVMAKLTTAKPDKLAAARSIFGILDDPIDVKEAREEKYRCE